MRKRGFDSRLTTYGDAGFSRFLRGAFLESAGYDSIDAERPVVGIADLSSDFNPCHRDMPALVAAVKRGVLEAGGLPMAFPTISLHEAFTHPTTMLLRNLAAMATEEMIRAQPMDAVVLLAGCDKTVPAAVMAALSADVPAILLVTGAMRTGSWRGERLGACTDCRRLWARHRADELDEGAIAEAQGQLCSTGGTCMVMGTASTMACLVEALGLMLAGGASPLSGTGERLRQAVATGRRAVGLAQEGLRPRDIIDERSLRNAQVVLGALSGSTNAVVHLAAIARRAGLSWRLDDLGRLARQVPVLVDCKPAGRGYMEDFHAAGGMPVLLGVLEPLLETSARVVEGGTLAERARPPLGEWQSTVRPLHDPVGPNGAIAVVRGTLAPDGAVIKAGAATRALFRHRGPACVFESPEDLARRIDSVDVSPDHVLVLRNAGPVGAGMPEAGSIPIPRALARRGVKDMVRVSDARMSGTAYGTIVLHVAPEAAVGGPLALVRDGDLVELDVESGRLDLLVGTEELARRHADWRPPPLPARGWARLYAQHVEQANLGADLDFL